MKRLVEETSGDGLEKLLGKEITLFCLNYIYAGTLVGVNETDVVLTDAKIVYETGTLTEEGFKNAQDLPGEEWFVRTGVIESYGEMS